MVLQTKSKIFMSVWNAEGNVRQNESLHSLSLCEKMQNSSLTAKRYIPFEQQESEQIMTEFSFKRHNENNSDEQIYV